MPRPRTKEDLMIAAKENYDKLNVSLIVVIYCEI